MICLKVVNGRIDFEKKCDGCRNVIKFSCEDIEDKVLDVQCAKCGRRYFRLLCREDLKESGPIKHDIIIAWVYIISIIALLVMLAIGALG